MFFLPKRGIIIQTSSAKAFRQFIPEERQKDYCRGGSKKLRGIFAQKIFDRAEHL